MKEAEMRCLFQSKIPDKFFLKCVRNAEKYEKIVFYPNLQEGELFLTQGIILLGALIIYTF